jgi:ethanolamine utilization microcompartment shell protein EutS
VPTASYTKIAAANEDLAEGINVGTDQWAICLASSAPGSKTFVSGTTDLATSGGYTAGGNNVSTTSAGMNGSDFVLVLADPTTWTATGGGFTFRYALLVNKTNNITLGYWDYGSSQVVAAGETVTVDLDQTASVGVFKLT